MRRSMYLLVFSLIFLLSGYSVSSAAEAPAPSITVQGNGSLSIQPDQAVVNVGVVTVSPSASEARTENARILNAVIQKLQSAGIPSSRIRTVDFSVSPLFNRSEKATPPTVTGYQVSNTLHITLQEVSSVGDILDIALTNGANQVYGIQFQKRNEDGLKQDVLALAVQDATLKAETIAKALGRTVGPAQIVTEQNISINSQNNQQYMMRDAGVGSTPVAPGTIQASASVSITFALQ